MIYCGAVIIKKYYVFTCLNKIELFAGFWQFLDAIFILFIFNKMATFTYLNNTFWYFIKIYIHCNTSAWMLALIFFLTGETGSHWNHCFHQIEFWTYVYWKFKEAIVVGFYLLLLFAFNVKYQMFSSVHIIGGLHFM